MLARLGSKHHVLGFDIAVDDVIFLQMGEGVRDLASQLAYQLRLGPCHAFRVLEHLERVHRAFRIRCNDFRQVRSRSNIERCGDRRKLFQECRVEKRPLKFHDLDRDRDDATIFVNLLTVEDFRELASTDPREKVVLD